MVVFVVCYVGYEFFKMVVEDIRIIVGYGIEGDVYVGVIVKYCLCVVVDFDQFNLC